MLMKLLNESGHLEWVDSGDFPESRVTFFEQAGFVHGKAVLEDGQEHELRTRIGGDGDRLNPKRRIFRALRLEHAALRPRPSAETIREHERRSSAERFAELQAFSP